MSDRLNFISYWRDRGTPLKWIVSFNNKLPICVVSLCLLAGCAPNKGPATDAYAGAYESVSRSLENQIRDLPKIVSPHPPTIPAHATPQERRSYPALTRNYTAAVLQYDRAIV